MDNKPKISLIIPVFNTEKYLEQCLDSAINQTLPDIEIICINDGSSDNSLEILKRYAQKDSRIKYLSQKNSGQSSARNKGLNIAQGEYIAFLDSDDWMQLDMLEKLYHNAKEQDCDISMCSITVFNEISGLKTEHDCYLSLDIIPKKFDNKIFNWFDLKDFIFKICVVPWNKIYKNRFLKENNITFCENFVFEDNLFCVETFIKAQKMNLTRDCLVNYRHFSASSGLSQSGDKDYKKLDFFKVLDLQENMLKDTKTFSMLGLYFKAHKKANLIYWYKKITNKKIKLKYALKLYRLYPDLIFMNFIDYFKKKQIIKKLNKLTKNKKIMFRGASLYLEGILSSPNLQNRQNILGIIDKNPEKIGTNIFEFRVSDYNLLREKKVDELVLSVLNIYNFEKIVKAELEEENLNIKINTDIFSIN